jgi:hypothetical protein
VRIRDVWKTDKRKGRRGKCSPYHTSGKVLVRTSVRLSHALDICLVPLASHRLWFVIRHNFLWRVEISKVINFLPPLVTFYPSEVKVKVKVHRNRPEGPEGCSVIALLFLDLGTRGGWVVSTTPRPLYPRERPGTHCTGSWVGPWAGLEVCEKSRPHRDSIPRPLHRLSYPGSWSKVPSYFFFQMLGICALVSGVIGELIRTS